MQRGIFGDGRSKYNVARRRQERTYKGVTYDSAMEMRYFIEIVEPMFEAGLIKYYERQKRYVLQDGFKRNGRTVLAINYVADFYIEYVDGHNEVIDVKGKPDSLAVLKRKLFWKIHPEISYSWVTYNKSRGGWIDYDELQTIRRKEKREAAKNAKRQLD